MNKIKITIAEKTFSKVSAEFSVQGEWRAYFKENEAAWIDYGTDIRDVPESVLLLPFVANILPVAWVCDAEVIAERLDADFLSDIEKAKGGYEKMYPMLRFGGKITAQTEKNVPTARVHQSAAFFSGGVDAWTTLMRHIEEKPVLLTVWGADIKQSDEKSWKNVDDANKKTAADFNLAYTVIRSNFREVINEGALSRLVKASGDGWWHGFQHGIALIGHAAPLAYLYGLEHLYIASSFPAQMAGKYTCASDPTIDNFVNFCGCRTVHDGYELDRLGKVRYLMGLGEAYTSKMKLRVCWQANASGKNCCRCEKCYRTILELAAVNCRGGVERYGFTWQDEDIKRCERDFKRKITIQLFIIEQMYLPLNGEFQKNKDKIPDFEKYEWLLDMDFARFNDYPIKRLRRAWHKVRAVGGSIKRRLAGLTHHYNNVRGGMTITFLGDVMLDAEQLLLHKRGEIFDFSGTFGAVTSLAAKSDFVVANLESPVAGAELGFTNEPYRFNSPVEFARALKESGVNLVTTANNHCLDRGTEGLKNTIAVLDKIDLSHIGTHAAEEPHFVIKEIGGAKIGFVALTYGTNAFANGVYLKKHERFMVDMFQNQELARPFARALYQKNGFFWRTMRFAFRRIGLFQLKKPVYERTERSLWHIRRYKKALRECKKAGAEYVISLLHTGGQYNDEPTALTRRICKKSVVWGADAVIANHEHVIHGYDKNLLRKRGKFCFCSLGNCLSSADVTKEPFGKYAQYSAAVSVKILRGVQEYSVIFLMSTLLSGGNIVVRSLFDEIEQCADSERKKSLLADNNALCNRVYGTQGIDYPLLREYTLD